MIFIRSLIFALAFPVMTVLLCIGLFFCMLLPRPAFMACVRGYFHCQHALEKYVLGLDYQVCGLEHLPKSGSFIVAAKHFSAYETCKLHLMLGDPAIVLKRELYRIPFWGWVCKKTDQIAINRSNPRDALRKLLSESKRMQASGRPIVIYPQGTRISVTETTADKPYKAGLSRIYETTGMPVFPMAHNSGLFWPKNAFIKKPGLVTFKILPPIPSGLDGDAMMKMLEAELETATATLIKETIAT